MIRAAELIQRKRDGEELPDDELAELILGYARGEVPDYQMAAFCMAVFFRGLSARETYVLTDAMIRSGETIDLGAELGRKVVDKHSTGGVGDKTSLAVGPIVAACGVPFGKMSGRGLGHTGGTLDKLESIPGYRTELGLDEFVAQVRDVGLAIIGQTGDLVPADKLLYGLRDVTATVDQLSLIAASIMSKKLAAGAQAIVLDVKVGDGAFMKTIEDARLLAEAMLSLGQAGRAGGGLPADRHGPAARVPRSATRSRCGRRSTPCAVAARPTSASSCSTRARGCWRCPTSASTLPRAADVPRPPSRTARPKRRGVAGSRRRAAPPTRAPFRSAPVERDVPRSDGRLRSPRRGDRRRQRRGAPRGRDGGRRRTRSTTPSASSASPSGGRRRAGRPLAAVLARDDATADEAVTELLAAYEIGHEPPPERPVLLEVVD